jgi:hypothetical protein
MAAKKKPPRRRRGAGRNDLVTTAAWLKSELALSHPDAATVADALLEMVDQGPQERAARERDRAALVRGAGRYLRWRTIDDATKLHVRTSPRELPRLVRLLHQYVIVQVDQLRRRGGGGADLVLHAQRIKLTGPEWTDAAPLIADDLVQYAQNIGLTGPGPINAAGDRDALVKHLPRAASKRKTEWHRVTRRVLTCLGFTAKPKTGAPKSKTANNLIRCLR